MSCAEALRRCPQAVFVRPRHARLPRVLAGGLGGRARGRADRRAHRPRRGLPRPRRGRAATSCEARALAEAVQAAVRGATSLSCSLGVASCKVVAKVASDRRKPGGLTVVPPGREAAFLAPFAVRKLPGVGPAGRGAARAPPASRRSARSPRSTTTTLRRLLPGKVGPHAARPRARDRPAAARDLGRAHLDQPRGDLRARHRRPRAAPRRAPADGRARSPSTCASRARPRAP